MDTPSFAHSHSAQHLRSMTSSMVLRAWPGVQRDEDLEGEIECAADRDGEAEDGASGGTAARAREQTSEPVCNRSHILLCPAVNALTASACLLPSAATEVWETHKKNAHTQQMTVGACIDVKGFSHGRLMNLLSKCSGSHMHMSALLKLPSVSKALGASRIRANAG